MPGYHHCTFRHYDRKNLFESAARILRDNQDMGFSAYWKGMPDEVAFLELLLEPFSIGYDDDATGNWTHVPGGSATYRHRRNKRRPLPPPDGIPRVAASEEST